MIARRFAVAIGLLVALVASQLPEYTQQYRQRLGGAISELKAIIAEFDTEAAKLSLDREQGIERLLNNGDPLARARGADMRGVVDREARLATQESDFERAGPVSQYLVLIEGLDPRLGEEAYGAYQPALPVTSAGLFSGLTGLFAGWGLTHLMAWPFRRRPERVAGPGSRGTTRA